MRTPTRAGFVRLVLVLTVGLVGCIDPAGPAPDVSVIRATDLGALPKSSDIVGRDGGYSGLFQGHVVWIYGDTFLAAPDALAAP